MGSEMCIRDRTVTALAARYARTYLPDERAVFIGAEEPIARGRADLAWFHPDWGYWFDELKTARNVDATLSPLTQAQVFKYLDAGLDRWGTEFFGVRLLFLGNEHRSLVLDASGDWRPLIDLHVGTTLPASHETGGVAS